MATTAPAIVWFRDDLRIADNPALRAAVDSDRPVLCLFVFDEESPGIRPYGAAAKWWLHQSLASLASDLEDAGARLIVRRGPAEKVIDSVVADSDAGAVFWNRRYGAERDVDAGIKKKLGDRGLEVHSFAGTLLFEPWTVQTQQGGSYGVFTPFYRACLDRQPPRDPVPRPQHIEGAKRVDSIDLDDLALLPSKPDWTGGMRDAWNPGEKGAHVMLRDFIGDAMGDYAKEHDEPAADATSGISPHLRWGEVSPYQIWRQANEARTQMRGDAAKSASAFLRQIVWREFAYHTLYFQPRMATVNIHRQYDAFPWPRLHPKALHAWQRGTTGVPLVDAGMRQLWKMGIMHNRVRLVTASFLVKNLLIDWRLGEQWFWETLVDADAASNPFNWQWMAGSGADAAPYFRIFNPELQREKFDPHGEYVRQWVPEWQTDDYPQPIVDLKETRRAALAAFDVVKRAGASTDTQSDG